MEENLRTISIGEFVVSDEGADVLVAYGVGSCVAICLYDPVAHVGGMLHALLPTPAGNNIKGNPAKFVDRGTPLLIEAMVEQGARRSRLVAKLCGGAQVLFTANFGHLLRVGDRNVAAAEEALAEVGIPIYARATGGTAGRTVKLYVADGQVTLRSLGKGEQVLSDVGREERQRAQGADERSSVDSRQKDASLPIGSVS